MGKVDLENLKQNSIFYFKDCEKELIDIYSEKNGEYEIGVIENFIGQKKYYEIYCFIEDKKNIVSGIKTKLIKNKNRAHIYYLYLKISIKCRGIKFFL